MKEIVPQFAKDYNLECSLDLSYGKTDEQIQYNVWMPRTVTKWFDKTQRSILYTVMQPGDEYTRVYIFVDKLGWNLFRYDKPDRNNEQFGDVSLPFDENGSAETLFYYDANGNKTREMIKTGDSSFRTTLYNYDNMGNLVANVQQGDSEDIVTRYTYDKVGNVLTMTTGLPSVDASGGNITTYTYDTFGRLASVTDPMGYTETYDEYSYMDDVVSKTDKMGNNITYVYL